MPRKHGPTAKNVGEIWTPNQMKKKKESRRAYVDVCQLLYIYIFFVFLKKKEKLTMVHVFNVDVLPELLSIKCLTFQWWHVTSGTEATTTIPRCAGSKAVSSGVRRLS